MPLVELGRGLRRRCGILRASLCVIIARLGLQALSLAIPVTMVCVSPRPPMLPF